MVRLVFVQLSIGFQDIVEDDAPCRERLVHIHLFPHPIEGVLEIMESRLFWSILETHSMSFLTDSEIPTKFKNVLLALDDLTGNIVHGQQW
jgi:hypothetical protein